MSLISTRETLFHYTNIGSLHGIVENNCIWLTNAYYLNDSNEIKFAIKHFERLIDESIKRGNTPKKIGFLNQLKEWIPGLYRDAHYIFVFSLSAQRNLLSQWRAYTPHGAGVSLGFEVDALKRLCTQKGLELVQCIYAADQRNAFLASLLSEVNSKFEEKYTYRPDSYEPKTCEFLDFLNSLAEFLLKAFCRIKDPTFSEECEWRLVSKYYQYYSDPDIKFRPSKTTLVPYIEVKLSGFRSDGYLFESIYVGPSPNSDLSHQAIVAYLSSKHACREFHNSMSPFREV